MRLEVTDLAFGYHGAPVGRDVSFRLGSGEVLCLLGPNGSGKTTLFRTVLGLLPRLGGAVHVDGEPTAHWRRPRLARAFGYVPQAQLGLFPFTLREVVLMGRTAHVGPFATPSRWPSGASPSSSPPTIPIRPCSAPTVSPCCRVAAWWVRPRPPRPSPARACARSTAWRWRW